MPTHRVFQSPIGIGLLALMIFPPIGFFSSLQWLKQQPDSMVFWVAGISSVTTVLASFGLSLLHDKSMDEWTRTNARFSSQWGWTAGASLIAILLAFPTFRELITSFIQSVVSAEAGTDALIVTSFTFGFIALVLAQILCGGILSVLWSFWMSRPARDHS